LLAAVGASAFVVVHLAKYWSSNSQYAFGWLVPPLAVLLLWRRALDAPAPDPCCRRVACVVLSATAFLLFPLWIFEQPNPDWRLVSWALALNVVALLLAGTCFLGGWAWVRHFSFPIGFLLTAVPWPLLIENSVIQLLMRAVAATAVALANSPLLGIAAIQRGNVIELSNGLLGIDDACSGVRSLQATIMASLFLGELYRFRWSQRAALFSGGIAIAFLSNLIRTVILTTIASRRGVEAVSHWHDSAGLSTMLLCFIGLWWLSTFFSAPPLALTSERSSPRWIPPLAAFSLLAWMALILVATEFWYSRGDQREAKRWSFSWPQEEGSFRPVPLSAEALTKLKADDSRAGTWADAEGRQWATFFMRWEAGPSRGRIMARMHRPEACLPASGWRLVRDHGVREFPVDDFTVPFQLLAFSGDGRRAHVWFCWWEDKSGTASQPGSAALRWASVASVLRRERHLAQQVMQVVLFDAPEDEDVHGLFERQIAPRLKAGGPVGK